MAPRASGRLARNGAGRRQPSRRLSRRMTFLPSERWCASMATLARVRSCPRWLTAHLSREATTTNVSIALTSGRACTCPPISTSPARDARGLPCTLRWPRAAPGHTRPRVRSMVATHPAPPPKNKKRQGGLTCWGIVSERFVTTRPQRAFTASAVVSLSPRSRRVCHGSGIRRPRTRTGSLVESLGLGARSLADGGEVGRGTHRPGTGAPARS